MTGKEISRMKRTDDILEEVYNMYYNRKFTDIYMKITLALEYSQKRPLFPYTYVQTVIKKIRLDVHLQR